MGGSSATIFAGIGLAVLGLAGCGTTNAEGPAESRHIEEMDFGSVSSEQASHVLSITADFSGVDSQKDIRKEGDQNYASLTI